MKSNKSLLVTSFYITVISCIPVFTSNDYYKTIFVGIFTGGIISLMTSCSLYINSKQMYFKQLYQAMTNIFINLYAIEDLINKIKKQPEHTQTNLQAIIHLIIEIYRDGAKINFQDYSPIIYSLSYYRPNIAKIYIIINQDLRNLKTNIYSTAIAYYENKLDQFYHLLSENEIALLKTIQELTKPMDKLYNLGAFEDNWPKAKKIFSETHAEINA